MHHTVKNTIVFLFFILMSVAGYSDQTTHNANEDTRHYTQKVFRSKAELVIQKSIKVIVLPVIIVTLMLRICP